jgi:hypothetical protein
MAVFLKKQSSDQKTLLVILALLAVCLAGWSAEPGGSQKPAATSPLPDKVNFYFHVKPLLSDRCFACHGPDE